METRQVNALKNAIRQPYAWPGGYPVYVIMNDGEMLCTECTRKEYKNILQSTRGAQNDGWRCVGADILWEGIEFCAHCSKQLESAYGEEETE